MVCKTNPKDRNIKRKISIIGAGYVGSTIAYALMMKELASEIVLIDINKKSAKGEVLDIRHGIPYMGSTTIHDGDYEDSKNSDLIIITAGRNRKSNETRLEMVEENLKIVREVIDKLSGYYTKGVIMIVSNPVDIITLKVAQWMDLPNGTVFGTGCILDTSRFVSVLAEFLGLNIEVINGLIVGEHGESQIPVWTKVTVEGRPIEQYCDAVSIKFTEVEKNMIAQKVKQMGTEIISNKGKTHYGIATCVCYLADAMLNRKSIIASVTSVLQGEYGVHDLALSLPSIIGRNGVEKRIVEKLDNHEMQLFRDSEKRLLLTIKSI